MTRIGARSHKIYSDKLRISVLDLKKTELATEEDRAYRIDHWARLFTVATWKEMKELAEKNPIFTDAARTAVILSEDEKVRLLCEAREDYYRRTGWKDEYIEQLTAENQQLAAENERLQQLLRQAGISADQEG